MGRRYGYYVTAMRKTEESLRRLKKGRKTTFSLFGGGAKDDEGRDEERIRTQMILDVEAFGREGEALGVEVGQSAAFRMLDEMVHREEGKSGFCTFVHFSRALTCLQVMLKLDLVENALIRKNTLKFDHDF